MDRGAWRATIYGVTQSRTWLSMHARGLSSLDEWEVYLPISILITVNVNFISMCNQLDYTIRRPGNWFNIILGVSVRRFLGEINIWMSRLSKAESTGVQKVRQGRNCWLFKLRHWSLHPDCTNAPGPQAFGLELELPGLPGFQLTADPGTSEPP